MPPGRVAAVRQGNSPEEWFSSLPGVSKVLLISLIGSTLLVKMGVVSLWSLALFWDPLWNKFEAWRLFTSAVFLGKPSMQYFMNLLIFVQYSIRYEKDAFDTGGGGGSADYLWMLVFGTTVLSILSIAFFQLPFLAFPLMFMVIYVWSRKTPDMPASFWGITVQSVFIPWIMVGVTLLIGDSVFGPLLGIAVGHLYYFLVDVLPDQYGKEPLFTPAFLVDFFGYAGTPGVQRFNAPGAVPAPRAPVARGGWGAGQPLGAR